MLTVEVYATSHIGRVRKGNEDNYLLLNISGSRAWTGSQDPSEFSIESQRFEVGAEGVVLAVSDGMGGALAGEVASQMAVETVSRRLLNDDPEATLSPASSSNGELIENLYEATLYANYLINRQSIEDPQYRGMGATFTGVALTPGSVDLIQVGDSRAYLIRNSKITQVTKDQSLVQQLIDANQIQPEEAETHAMKNVILQALGAQPEVYPVPARLIPQQGDLLLICSDGLSNKIRNADMLAIIMQNADNLSHASAMLVKEANENGGEDNITLIIAKLSGHGLPEATQDEPAIYQLTFANIHDTNDQEDTAEII